MKLGSRIARRPLSAVGALLLVLAACVPPGGGGGGGGTTTTTTTTVPAEDQFLTFPMISGLTAPTNVEFAPNGRVFVAEKSGIVKTFDSITDTTPTIAADLTAPVRSVGEHGLLGMVVDPEYPDRPYVYVMHAWDSTGFWGDGCAAGYGTNGCVTGARISRLTMGPTGVMTGAPQTIVDNRWCYQFASHGVGDLEFLDDGTMVASSGEGAYWVGADYGQFGGQQLFPPVANLTPRNPCGDPPSGVGGAMNPVTAEGGSFRAQDLITESDPVWWNGSIIRIDPDTGAAPDDNPLVGIGQTADDHVLAHGLRNPFRLTARPGTDEIYLADVGYGNFEEINRTSVDDEVVENFGWPCKEGPNLQNTFAALNNNICATVLGGNGRTTLTDPFFHYRRGGSGGAISAIAVVPPGRYDSSIVGDLIFSDYVKGLTWTLGITPSGAADPAGPVQVASDGIVVDLEAAPDGYVYTVDYYSGTVNRLVDKDSAPVARVTASPTSGPLPLTVDFDASSSTQPGGGALSFAWDLDEDGQFDDRTGPTASLTLTTAQNRTVKVRVTNAEGAYTDASSTVYPGNTKPNVTIQVNSALPWTANGPVSFQILATDAEDGVLPESSVSWDIELKHCYTPSDCHSHPYVGEEGSNSGDVTGPSHGYPSFLRLVAWATDSRGLRETVSVDLQPAAVTLQVTSNPSGAKVTIGDEQRTTPFTYTAIKNDSVSISAITPQTIGGQSYRFSSWSNGQPASHQYLASNNGTLNLQMAPAP